MVELVSPNATARPRIRARAADGPELTAYPGEVVGLAGLAGQGQSEMLRRIFDAARRWRGEVHGGSVEGDAAIDSVETVKEIEIGCCVQ